MTGIRKSCEISVLRHNNKTAVSSEEKENRTFGKNVQSSEYLSVRARQFRDSTLAQNPDVEVRSKRKLRPFQMHDKLPRGKIASVIVCQLIWKTAILQQY